MSILELSNIKLVLFDVDGVLTDGTIYISEQGECLKSFNVKDGLVIELLRLHGILTGVLSGKASPALDFRCKQLGFDFVITGCKNKLPKVSEICKNLNIDYANIAFCGDDVLDLPVMQLVGLGVAPADAHALVLENADLILSSNDGKGVAREFADKWLTVSGQSLTSIYDVFLNKTVADDVKNIEQ